LKNNYVPVIATASIEQEMELSWGVGSMRKIETYFPENLIVDLII
jgi:hypothetical protein